MISNFATAITSSTAVTFALFYVMSLLISMQAGAVVEPRERAVIDWVRIQRTKVINVIPPLPDRIRNPQPPPMPDISKRDFGDDTLAIPEYAPLKPGPINHKSVDVMPSGPLVNLVPVRPLYPPIAEQRGLSGYVLLRFDVLTDGTVTNIQIVESSDRVFERSSVRAANKLRFKPLVVDGRAQESLGVYYRFTYQMESE